MKTPNNKAANTVAVQGKLAAVGANRGGLFLIDLATASVLHALQGHTGNVMSVIFDGDEIISGSKDKTLRVWDKISGRETLRIDAGANVNGVAVYEDLLVAGLQDNTVRVFDRASGDPRHLLTEATTSVKTVAIDAERMVSGSYAKVRVYDVPSFVLLSVLKGHTGMVSSVAVEGDRIVSGSWDNTVRVWDARSGDTLHVLQGHSNSVNSVSLSGSEIVSGSDDSRVRVWDAETGASTRVLDGTEAVRPIEEVLGGPATTAAAKEALKAALANGDPAELGRCKLMVIGQGAAGKTSTVRSLLGMAPVTEHISTVGVELTRTDAESWEEEEFDSGFERQAYRVAALRMAAQEQAASRNRQSLLRRASLSLANVVRRLSPAGQPFVAEEQVELVPEAEMAQRFEYAEIEDMAGQTQSGQKIKFTIWDYAGQDVFYALHHIFLTREGGVFMLVFDMQELLTEQDKALRYLRFWLNSVKLHAPKAPVLLVATHYDQASSSLQAVEKILQSLFCKLRGIKLVKNSGARLSFFPIDNMSPAADRAADLRAAVEKAASKLEAVSQKISLRWLKVLDDLMKLNCDHVPFAKVQELATKYHAGDQTNELLSFFHELGMLVHLRATETLHDKVILNPQWLLDKLSRVIADEIHVQDIYYDERLSDLELEDDFALLRHKGIGSRALLEFLWDDEEVEYLVEFMRSAMLLSNWDFPEDAFTSGRQGEPLYLVSSLLKNSTDADLDAEIADMDLGLTCILDFTKFFLPDGVFARLLSLCAQHSGVNQALVPAPRLAGNKAIIFFGLSVFALEQTQDKIWIRVEHDSEKPASTLKMLVSMFRGARDAVFRDLPWELILQSPKNKSILVSYDSVVQAHLPLGPGLENHVFLSHKQIEAGDACNLMAEKLVNRGLKVWVDQRMEGNLSSEKMRAGIQASKCYLLFLSKTVFSSEMVCMELDTALRAEKPILLVHESDTRRVGFAEFQTYFDTVPETAQHIFDLSESMPFQRRLYLTEGFYNELIRRIESFLRDCVVTAAGIVRKDHDVGNASPVNTTKQHSQGPTLVPVSCPKAANVQSVGTTKNISKPPLAVARSMAYRYCERPEFIGKAQKLARAGRMSGSVVFEGEVVVTGRRRLVRVVRSGRAPAVLQWRSRDDASRYEWQPEAVHEIVEGETSVLGGVQGGVLVVVAGLISKDPSHAVSSPRITRRYIFSGHNKTSDSGTEAKSDADDPIGRAHDFVEALKTVGVVVSSENSEQAWSGSGRGHRVQNGQDTDQPTPSAIALERGRALSRVLTMADALYSPAIERKPLSDSFELEDLLGEGGFANVYRAVHIRSGVEVAVKIMLLTADETAADQRDSLTESKPRSSTDRNVNDASTASTQIKRTASGTAMGLSRVPSDISTVTILEDDLTPPNSPLKVAVNTSQEGLSHDQGICDEEQQVSPAAAAAAEHARRVRNFEWEIRVMRKIRDELSLNPNLMRLYAVCTAADPPRTCIVMEKLNGGELFERIVERKHFTERDAAHLFRTLIRALHELHRIGVVHRDLKPENVIFNDASFYSAVKIADFGTALLMDAPEDDPYKDKRIGSPGYAAPEVNRMIYTPACDIWSMGVLLYTLLCGYSPFPEGFMQIIKVMSGQFEFHEDKWGSISDEAKDLICQMIKVSMEKRITTTEILKHPWLEHLDLEEDHAHHRACDHGETEADLGDAQRGMKSYILRRKFKTAATAAMISARMRLNRIVKDKTMEGIRGRRRAQSRSSEFSFDNVEDLV
ncbi:Protein kinase, putative [Hondaea fermentalgiana]|uniref:non-specific serine/threonine protein kinase n=1 Tax=Hondaea fermentalgiana TaxID=2315210 RepID=A0A2R5GY09_9STRA|nr:Protein kinase, putative [Hondaea fermentalgiana]|eukprot:GBG33603.1 Protein kinase, putative [Hondaea fermentalgiana]